MIISAAFGRSPARVPDLRLLRDPNGAEALAYGPRLMARAAGCA